MSITPSVIGKFLKDSFNSENERKTLDTTRLHFIPINMEIFKKTLSHAAYDARVDDFGEELDYSKLYDNAAKYVKSRHKNKIQITTNGFVELGTSVPLNIDLLRKKLPAVVYDKAGTYIVGALYSGFNPTYEGVFRNFFNKEVEKFLSRSRYDKANTAFKETNKKSKGFNIGFDVGHIYSESSDLGDTPLKKAISTLQSALDGLSGNTSLSSSQVSQISDIKKEVTASLSELSSKSSYGTNVLASLSKDITSSLASVSAIVVIAQDRLENQYEYGTLIEGKIAAKITEMLKQVHFSPTLLDEIHNRAIAAFTSSKVLKDIHSKISLDVGKIPKKGSKVSISSSTLNISKVPSNVVKSTTLSKYSLTSLQALLDAQLQHVISANMGDGSSKRLLNYRTGRFAASAKVERLSMSKEGAITAFYSYMRNPYGTFSEGGAQQYPKTRDPKLLISQSIREIAATKVANRLRAVLV